MKLTSKDFACFLFIIVPVNLIALDSESQNGAIATIVAILVFWFIGKILGVMDE